MHVIEIFLPLKRNDGGDQPNELFGDVRRELTDRFGGLTAFSRAPAQGLWEGADGKVDRDAIVIFEVMTEDVDRLWWSNFRARLESSFDQDEILIRASPAERL